MCCWSESAAIREVSLGGYLHPGHVYRKNAVQSMEVLYSSFSQTAEI